MNRSRPSLSLQMPVFTRIGANRWRIWRPAEPIRPPQPAHPGPEAPSRAAAGPTSAMPWHPDFVQRLVEASRLATRTPQP